MFHSVGFWVVLAILAFSCLWFFVIRAYARRHGSDLSLLHGVPYNGPDVMYNPDPGNSQRSPDSSQPPGHHGGGFTHGGWSGGGSDSGGSHHH